jgi:hypothetical protein
MEKEYSTVIFGSGLLSVIAFPLGTNAKKSIKTTKCEV